MMKCDELKAFNMPRYAGEFTMHEVYLKSDVDSAIDELKSAHHKERHEYIKMVAELKEERRWRKFPDEKPNEKMEGQDFIVSNGFYSVVCEWRGYWNNEPFCGDKNYDEVKYWMPLPSAPEDADK
jgi:hypothetical protein